MIIKIIYKYLGLILLTIGVFLLISTRFQMLGTHNWLLISGMVCIVGGIYFHILAIKHESRY